LKCNMSNKTPKPSSNQNKPTKPVDEEKVVRILKTIKLDIHPSNLLEKSAELWAEFETATGAKKKELTSAVNKKLGDAVGIYNLENHYLVAETLNDKRYQTLLLSVVNQLVDEYKCNTASEKMLAETAGWAYCRAIEYGRKLNALTRQEYLSSEKNGYYSMLSKEVDRATRQYIGALQALKTIKQPPLSVTFKADNAFVAQNQQINAHPDNSAGDKNNAGQ